MTTWSTKYDARGSGAERPITSEPHVIGEDITGYVLLDEVPLQETPSSVHLFVGGVEWAEVTTSPGPGQYQVTYSGRLMGAIIFNALDNGTSVTVTYKGRGSNAYARDINKLQTLKVDADGAIPITGALKHANGTAAAPSLTFDSDTDTGIYRSAANAVGVAVGGAQVGNFTSTGLAITGLLAATTLSGDGSALTALNAANLASGTVPTARVVGTYANITGLGTITTGVWTATAIANAYIASGLDVAKLTTGTTLPSNVVTSSLTSVGTLAALTVSGTSTLGVVTATGLTATKAGAPITSSNTTTAAQINLHLVIQKNNITKANIGTDASDNFAIFNAAGDTANLTITNAGAVTVRSTVTATGATLSGALSITAGGASITGTVTATAFSGSGASLTSLAANQVTTGTLADARLSTNVPLKNTQNVYTALQALSGATISTVVLMSGLGSDTSARFSINADGTMLWGAGTGLTDTSLYRAGVASLATDGDFYINGTLFASGTIQGDLAGNASTATALQTPRTINGVSFSGTANITITAAAGTLTGTTINASVVTSSLTTLGTLTALSVSGTATHTHATANYFGNAETFYTLTSLTPPGSVSSPSYVAIGNGAAGIIRLYRTQGWASTAAVASASNLGQTVYGGFDGVALAAGASIIATTTELWTTTGHGTKLVFNVIANGTTTSAAALTLDQDKTATFGGNALIGTGTLAAYGVANLAGAVQGVQIGVVGGAITSTTDAYIGWMNSSATLNLGAINGSLLLASRNVAGAEVVIATENAVRGRWSSGGLLIGSDPSPGATEKLRIGGAWRTNAHSTAMSASGIWFNNAANDNGALIANSFASGIAGLSFGGTNFAFGSATSFTIGTDIGGTSKVRINGSIDIAGVEAYRVAGANVLYVDSGNYTNLCAPGGNPAVTLGKNAVDPNNYYNGDAHVFRSRSTSSTYGSLLSTGLSLNVSLTVTGTATVSSDIATNSGSIRTTTGWFTPGDVPLYWKDSGGTYRRTALWSATNGIYYGDIDNTNNATLNLMAGGTGQVNVFVNNNIITSFKALEVVNNVTVMKLNSPASNPQFAFQKAGTTTASLYSDAASTLKLLDAGGSTVVTFVSGALTLSTVTVGAAPSADASMGTSATDGFTLRAKPGSSYDFSLIAPSAATYFMRVPTGTANVQFSATISATNYTGNWNGYGNNLSGGPFGGAPDSIVGLSSSTLQRYNATAIAGFLNGTALTPATLVVGTDPGGTQVLRVGGYMLATRYYSNANSDYFLLANSATTGWVMGRAVNNTADFQWGISGAGGAGVFTGAAAYAGNIGLISNSPLQFFTNATLRGQINADGSWVVGGTLQVNGCSIVTALAVKAAANCNFLIGASAGTTSLNAVNDANSANTPMAFYAASFAFNVGATTFASTVTATAFYTSSSRAVKKNITPFMDSALDILRDVSIVNYRYRDFDEEQKVGFIAEDTHFLLSGRAQKHLDTANSIGLLIKSVQELSAENKALRSEIEMLKQRAA